MLATRETFPLLAELLADQQRLDTPVARFSTAHSAGSISQLSVLSSQLIPLSKPRAGEQYAFEVELDSCTGCKSCVAACHSLNGLDDTETWRDVGLLVSTSRRHPFTQTITTACHHCEDPACLNGCPVLAYEKDPATGIVRHLDDQCIGCSYCILKCPYDVPKFSERLGIVRKCDMCHSRLAEGEAPACVQACPTHAIRIVTVSITTGAGQHAESGDESPHSKTLPRRSDAAGVAPAFGVRRFIAAFSPARPSRPDFLPAAPEPSYTRPTTRYVSKRGLPENLIAGDAAVLRVQPAHWPLAIMLTLMPAAVGLSCVAAFAAGPVVTYYVKIAAVGVGGAGLTASVFHLGQPLRAWRIFLGWRKSWLSREAMAFGAWFATAAAAIWIPSLCTAAAVVGAAALVCSAMIYVDTRRGFWRATQTFPRFFGTAVILGTAFIAPGAAALLLVAKLSWELLTFCDRSTAARLQRGPLRRSVAARDLLGFAGAALLVSAPLAFALPVVLAGELIERYLFFRAVDAPKMPGLPA